MKFRGKSHESAKSPVSIQDVADKANVSIATVSRVLNNHNVVSSQTAARVRDVISALGFVPNPFAQGLITRESRVLCFALPDMFGEFYSQLIRGADAEAHARNYHLLVSSDARGKPQTPAEQRLGLGLGLADGLAVMITEPSAIQWKDSGDHSIPVVLIDFEVKEPHVDCVLIDNAAGAAQATEHLLQGTAPADLYFVGGPAENFDTKARADAFISTLASRGHNVRPDQVVFGKYELDWGATWFNQTQFNQTRRTPEHSRGIGVLAANDEIALGVLQAAEDAGVTAPHQIRVVGFDDTRLASLVRPKLSSVRVPTMQVGAAAISLLAQRLENPDREPTTLRIATTFIARQSSIVLP